MKKNIDIKEINLKFNCPEDWNKMDVSSSNTRHCQVCKKYVTDFSQSSPEEIVAFFERNSQNNTCGRFRENQFQDLNQHLKPTKKSITAKYIAPLVLSTILATSSCVPLQNSTCNSHKPTFEIVKNDINQDSQSTIKITGVVLQKDGDSLPGATIHIENTKTGVVTNIDGNFVLEFDKKLVSEESNINISFIGMENFTIKLKDIKNKNIKIMLVDDAILTGEVVVTKRFGRLKRKQ